MSDSRGDNETTDGRAADAVDHRARNRRRAAVYRGTFAVTLVALVPLLLVAYVLLRQGIRLLSGRPLNPIDPSDFPYVQSAGMGFMLAHLAARRVCRRYKLSDDAESVEDTLRLVPADAVARRPQETVEVRYRVAPGYAAGAVGLFLITGMLGYSAYLLPSNEAERWPMGVFVACFALGGVYCGWRVLYRPDAVYARANAAGLTVSTFPMHVVPWAKIARCRVRRVRDVFGRPTKLTLAVYGSEGGEKAQPLGSVEIPVHDVPRRASAEELVRAVRSRLIGEATQPVAPITEQTPMTRSTVAAADAPETLPLTAGRGRAMDR